MTARTPLWITFALGLVLLFPMVLLIKSFELGALPAALLVMADVALITWITRPPEAFGLPREPRTHKAARSRR